MNAMQRNARIGSESILVYIILHYDECQHERNTTQHGSCIIFVHWALVSRSWGLGHKTRHMYMYDLYLCTLSLDLDQTETMYTFFNDGKYISFNLILIHI